LGQLILNRDTFHGERKPSSQNAMWHLSMRATKTTVNKKYIDPSAWSWVRLLGFIAEARVGGCETVPNIG
jgi:hypothetical protein